jgi:predicted Holliday junction resolvase-like endonuclease
MIKKKYARIPWAIFIVVVILFFANMLRNNHQRELDRQHDAQQRELNRQIEREKLAIERARFEEQKQQDLEARKQFPEN